MGEGSALAVKRSSSSFEPKSIGATLRRRYNVADGLSVFVFHPEIPLSWEPGQYATIGVHDGHRLIERPYSICSWATEGFLEFFIELVPSGALTPLLWNLREGDQVSARVRTRGKFLLDTESGRTTHLMVATVTGIAPYVSMLRRHRLDIVSGKTRPVHRFIILHGGSHSRELAYQDEFRVMCVDVKMLRYIASVSRPWEEPDWSGEVGRAEDVLRKYLDNIGVKPVEITAYLCGHPGMIQTGEGVLKRVGMPRENIRIEQYFPASGV